MNLNKKIKNEIYAATARATSEETKDRIRLESIERCKDGLKIIFDKIKEQSENTDEMEITIRDSVFEDTIYDIDAALSYYGYETEYYNGYGYMIVRWG